MEAHMANRARKLVAMLQSAGRSCGLLVVQRTVVMRCPGSPFTDSPTMYDEADLTNAIELNLVRKQKMVGSYEWEYYVAREHPNARICAHCKDSVYLIPTDDKLRAILGNSSRRRGGCRRIARPDPSDCYKGKGDQGASGIPS